MEKLCGYTSARMKVATMEAALAGTRLPSIVFCKGLPLPQLQHRSRSCMLRAEGSSAIYISWLSVCPQVVANWSGRSARTLISNS